MSNFWDKDEPVQAEKPPVKQVNFWEKDELAAQEAPVQPPAQSSGIDLNRLVKNSPFGSPGPAIPPLIARPEPPEPLAYKNQWPETSYMRSPDVDFTIKLSDGQEVIISTDGKNQQIARWNANDGTFDTDYKEVQQVQSSFNPSVGVGMGSVPYMPPVRNETVNKVQKITPDKVLGYADATDKVETAKVALARSLIPTAAGFAGFGGGMALGTALAPATGMASMLIPLGLGAVGGFGTGMAGQALQDKAFPITPEQQLALASNPNTAGIAGFAPALIASPTSPRTWANLASKAPGVAGKAATQLGSNAVMMGALGTGNDVGANLVEGRSPLQGVGLGSVLHHAGTGLLLGHPNKLGRAMEFPGRAPVNALLKPFGKGAYAPSATASDIAAAAEAEARAGATPEATAQPLPRITSAEAQAKYPNGYDGEVVWPDGRVTGWLGTVESTVNIVGGEKPTPAKVAPYPGNQAPLAQRLEWFEKHGKTHFIDGEPMPARLIEGTPEYQADQAAIAEAAAAKPAAPPAATPSANVEAYPAMPDRATSTQAQMDAYLKAGQEWTKKHGLTHNLDGTPRPKPIAPTTTTATATTATEAPKPVAPVAPAATEKPATPAAAEKPTQNILEKEVGNLSERIRFIKGELSRRQGEAQAEAKAGRTNPESAPRIERLKRSLAEAEGELGRLKDANAPRSELPKPAVEPTADEVIAQKKRELDAITRQLDAAQRRITDEKTLALLEADHERISTEYENAIAAKDAPPVELPPVAKAPEAPAAPVVRAAEPVAAPKPATAAPASKPKAEPAGVVSARDQLAKLEASGNADSPQAKARRKYIRSWEKDNGLPYSVELEAPKQPKPPKVAKPEKTATTEQPVADTPTEPVAAPATAAAEAPKATFDRPKLERIGKGLDGVENYRQNQQPKNSAAGRLKNLIKQLDAMFPGIVERVTSPEFIKRYDLPSKEVLAAEPHQMANALMREVRAKLYPEETAQVDRALGRDTAEAPKPVENAPIEAPKAADPVEPVAAKETKPVEATRSTEDAPANTSEKPYSIPGEGPVSKRRMLEYLVETRDWNDNWNISTSRKTRNDLMNKLAKEFDVNIEAEAKRLAEKKAAEKADENFDPVEEPNPRENPKDVAEREALTAKENPADTTEPTAKEVEIQTAKNIIEGLEKQIAAREKAGKGDSTQAVKQRAALERAKEKLAELEGKTEVPASEAPKVDPELAKIDALKISEAEKAKIRERYLRDKKNYEKRQQGQRNSEALAEKERQAVEDLRAIREREQASAKETPEAPKATEPTPTAEAPKAEPSKAEAQVEAINEKLAELERTKKGDSPEAEALRTQRDKLQATIDAQKPDSPDVLSRAEKWADDTIAEIRRQGRQRSGLDPELLAAYAVKGAVKFGRTLKDFKEFSREMVNEFGNGIRPHLKAIFDKAQEPGLAREYAEQQQARNASGRREPDLAGESEKMAQLRAEERDNNREIAEGRKPVLSAGGRTWRSVVDSPVVAFFKNIGMRMRTIADNNPQSETAQKIVNDFSLIPGTRETGPDFNMAHSNERTRFFNKFSIALGPVLRDMRRMSAAELLKFNDIFIKAVEGRLKTEIGGETGEAVKRVREVMNELHAYGKEAGLDMGKVTDYFPRQISAESVAKDRAGFEEAAAKAYERQWERLQKEGLETKDTDPVTKKVKVTTQAELGFAGETTQRPNFKDMARKWADAIELGQEGFDLERGIFDDGNPATKENFQKNREFTKEEAAEFDAFREKDFETVLSNHIGSMVRRAEVARRLGADGMEWKKIASKMKDEGVSAEDIAQLKNDIQSNLGMSETLLSERGQEALNTYNLVSSTAFLKLTGLLNIAEPASIGIRQRDPIEAGRAMASNLFRIRNVLTRMTPGEAKSVKTEIERIYGKGHDLASALAIELGITNVDHGLGSLSSGFHLDAGTDSGGKIRRVNDNVYRMYGIHATEVAKRETSIKHGMRFIDKSIQFLEGNSNLQRIFRAMGKDVNVDTLARDRIMELGIKEADVPTFIEFSKSLRGMDSNQQLKTIMSDSPMAAEYRKAIQMFNKQSSVQATRASRPDLANKMPIGKMLFQFATFTNEWAAQHGRYMLESAKKVKNEDGRYNASERLLAAGVAPAFAVTTAGMWGIRAIINKITGFKFEESEVLGVKVPGWVKSIADATVYTGILGPAEAAYKWAVRDQPPGGVFGDWMQKSAKAFGRIKENPDSNAAQKTATKIGYRSGFVPAANTGLGVVSAAADYIPNPALKGTVKLGAATLAQVIAGNRTEDAVATAIAGEDQKGTKNPPRATPPRPPSPPTPR